MLTLCLVFYLSNPFLYPAPIKGIAHMLEFANIVYTAPSGFKTLTIAAKLNAIYVNTQRYAPLYQLGLGGDSWLILCGLIVIGTNILRSPRICWQQGVGLIALWIVVMYVGITLWLPNDWERYTLQLQPCNALLESVGLVALLRLAFAVVGRARAA